MGEGGGGGGRGGGMVRKDDQKSFKMVVVLDVCVDAYDGPHLIVYRNAPYFRSALISIKQTRETKSKASHHLK